KGPAAGAGVKVEGEEILGEKEASTDASGRFRVAGLPAGALTLAARAPGLLPVVLEMPLELAPGEERKGLELVFRAGGAVGRVMLHVEDPRGGVLATGEAGAGGQFRISGLASGAARLRGQHPSYPDARLDLGALERGEKRSGLVLAFPAGAAVEGHALGRD